MRYEIFVNAKWVDVTEWIFRSWSGQRRLNGREYIGPVFLLGSETLAGPAYQKVGH